MTFDIAEFRRLVGNRLAQIVAVVSGPGTCRNKVVFVLCQPHDGVFGARGARTGQRIGQVDAANAGQLVAGEPVKELRGTGALDQMFGERGRVDQAHALADRLCLVHRVLPPATATEAAGVVVVEAFGRVIVRAFPAVDPAELCALCGLPVIGRRRAQRATSGPLLVWVVQDVDVLVGFLVLARSKLGGHPVAIAFGVQRRHVDLGLALDHQLRQIITGATRRRDPEREPFGQPHVAQSRRRTHQRVAIGGVADRSVEIVLQAAILGGRNTVVHRHVLIFDPVQVELEQIRAEAVRHTVFEPRRRVGLVNPEDPAATLLAHIGLRIGITDNGVFDIAGLLAEFDQLGVLIHHDELVLDRNGRHLDAQHLGGALRVVAAGGHHMFGGDHDLLVRRDQVAPFFDHLGRGHFPRLTVPMERIRLPLPLDHHTALACALGHRHGHVCGVNIAIGLVIQRAFQVLGADQRPLGLDLVGGHEGIGHAAGFCGRGIEHILVHALFGLCHAQVAHNGKARIQPGFLFQRLVEADRIVVNVGRRKGHVEIGQQARCVPGRPRGQLVPLQQHDIIPARAGQMIGNRRAHGSAADHKCFDVCFHDPIP